MHKLIISPLKWFKQWICSFLFFPKLLFHSKQEGNVLLEPAAPMFHLFIFGNVSIKNPKIHEIQKSVNSKNP